MARHSQAAELTQLCTEPDGTDPRLTDPFAVWTYAMDGAMPICMTLDMLDEWWRSQSPQQKAEAWERSLEDPAPVTASDSMETLLAAVRHPLNLVFEAAELIALQHHTAIAEAKHTVRRCSAPPRTRHARLTQEQS